MSGGEQGTARVGAPGGVLEVDELWELVQAGLTAGKLSAEEITLTLDESKRKLRIAERAEPRSTLAREARKLLNGLENV